MSFTDLHFLFGFLPLFLAVYYLTPAAWRVYVLIAGSLLFYGFVDPWYCVLLFLLCVWNHLLVRGVRRRDLATLATAVAGDVAALVAAKLLAGAGVWQLPVGMSFYVFRMIFYQADAWRGRMEREPRFADSLAYFCLFPQLLSGPIMRYETYERIAAFREPAPGRPLRRGLRDVLVRIENGLTYLFFGLSLKVLLSDHLRSLWSSLGTIGYESLSAPLAWLGAYAYSMELYYDFWGYSLMAAGIGIMIGLPMVENFLQPYVAGSVSEFYRRWHATLGTFFRENVYFPLGGSRGGWGATVRNLFVVWLLTGLWHGVGWNYLLWSMSLLLMILMERALRERGSAVLPVLGRIHVLLFVPLTWVVFAIPEGERLVAYFSRLFPLAGTAGAVYAGDFMKYLGSYGGYLAWGLVFLHPGIYHGFVRYRRSPWVAVLLAAAFVMSLVSLSRAGDNPFLYLQF